ncbi:hypothetical protein LN047_12190 [Achromobacter sp. JD417]|uniref:hypothetical protein n=1 Tax=Achromobacter sp. JD417 TaxID=2893881 RepID=UPI0035A67681
MCSAGAYNAAVLGVDAYAKFELEGEGKIFVAAGLMGGVKIAVVPTPFLKYQILLPRFDTSRASYSWYVMAKRYPGQELLASGSHEFRQSLPKSEFIAFKRMDYDPKTTAPLAQERTITSADGDEQHFLVIEGKIQLVLGHQIDEVKVVVEYLPNVLDPEMSTYVEVVETK